MVVVVIIVNQDNSDSKVTEYELETLVGAWFSLFSAISGPPWSPSTLLPTVYQMLIPESSVAGVPNLKMHITFPPDTYAS
jgi:hypothetical protein